MNTKKRISSSCFRVFVVGFVLSGRAALSGPPDRGPERPALQQTTVERGKQIYMRVGCYACHGREAQGASTGPRLGPNPLPLPVFSRAVRTPRNEMPPYSRTL